MMKSAILWSAAAITAASASVALAAGVGISPSKLGGGNGSVVACETDGFTIAYTTSRGNVTAVTVGAIADPGCEGGSLSLTLTNSAGTSIGAAGPQTIPTDGDVVANSVSLAPSPQPGAAQVAGYHVSITGP